MGPEYNCRMQSRRIIAAAGALAINGIVAAVLISGTGPVMERPQRPDPIIARMIAPEPVVAPASPGAPASVGALASPGLPASVATPASAASAGSTAGVAPRRLERALPPQTRNDVTTAATGVPFRQSPAPPAAAPPAARDPGARTSPTSPAARPMDASRRAAGNPASSPVSVTVATGQPAAAAASASEAASEAATDSATAAAQPTRPLARADEAASVTVPARTGASAPHPERYQPPEPDRPHAVHAGPPTALAASGATAGDGRSTRDAVTATAGAEPVAGLASGGSTDAAQRAVPRLDASWAGNATPPYPAIARRMGEEGEVRLDVHVAADGTVADVRLRASSGSAALDRSAIDTVRRWRFSPAMVDGRAVAEWYRDWRWVFKLEG